MRALPGVSEEYFEETTVGKTVLPVAAGAGAGDGVAVFAGGGVVACLAGAAAGAAAGVAASVPHCALRKSLHFMPLSAPPSLAALYLALHSCMVIASAEWPI